MPTFKVCYWDFPEAIHNKIGGCLVQKNNNLIIFVDSLQPSEVQNHFLRHELAHIALGHLNALLPDDGTEYNGFRYSESEEAQTDKYADQMTDDEFNDLMQYASIEHLRQ